jgi:chromosome segregation ATPase
VADRPASPDDRIARLTRAYRSILDRYREIERSAVEERELLGRGPDCIAEVNALLERKRATLARIRDEEERVKGAREWWKKARRSLPAEAGSELLALLDEISRTVERLLALESECRRLLERRTAWGPAPEPSVAGTGSVARAAYGKATAVEGKAR